jgi:hypothetical protein
MHQTRDHSAVVKFVAAVYAFSDDPSRENLARYLKASRDLEHRAPNSPRRVAAEKIALINRAIRRASDSFSLRST